MDTDFDNRIGSLKRNKTFQTTGSNLELLCTRVTSATFTEVV